MNKTETSKEAQILRLTRKVLTSVAKDTFTQPGVKHPLSEETILGIRDCLSLISAREREIQLENGQDNERRPHFSDDPQKTVVVPLHKSGLPKKSDD